MDVTLAGMVIDPRPDSIKADFPMDWTLPGMAMDVKLEQ